MGTRQEELDGIEREKKILTNQDLMMGELRNVQREVLILRKGFEAAGWGEKVEEMPDAEMEEVPPKEGEE